MEVRLLGPLQVLVEGVAHPVPGAGERAVLARLALRAGRVVPVDHLVDDLWGENLPRNPGNALQLRISKLRRALATLGAEPGVVVTRDPGYLLDVSGSAVDALRVVEQIRAARRLAERGDTEAALASYREALSAWRGPALVEFPDAEWAVLEARRLEDLRVAAEEERLALELEVGRHAEALDDLARLADANPLRERPHALLMLALYRAGRQADALAAFRSARATLDEALGLEPSPELRTLQAAILRHDPTLDLPPAAPRVEPNLPQRQASVIGRETELAVLARLLGEHRLVTVTGPGGMGKTTVAVEAARSLAEQMPDGGWFVALAGVSGPGQVVARTATDLGLPPAESLPGESAEQRLARQVGHRRAVVVVDNCEHVVEEAAVAVDALLQRCPHLVVIATSREPLGVRGEAVLALAPLESGGVEETDSAALERLPAVRLFLERAHAASASFRLEPDDAAAVTRICRRLDGIPLAIELAAARTRTLSVAHLAERLADPLRLLGTGPRTAEARHRTLRATIDWSHELLDDDERAAFRRLAVFRGTWTVEDAEAVCGFAPLTREAILGLVEGLVARSLVSVPAPGAFRLLETIREYAAERLAESGDEEIAVGRAIARLSDLAARAAAGLRGHTQQTWRARLAASHDDLVAGVAAGIARPDRFGEDSLRLAARLGWFWYLGDHDEGRRLLTDALAAIPPSVTTPLTRGLALQALAVVGRPNACIVHPSGPCAAAAEESLPWLDAAGDRAACALSRVLLAVEGLRGSSGREALRMLDDAEADLAEASWERALAAFVRMELLVRADDADAGIDQGHRAAADFARLGDLWGVSAVRGHQAANLRLLGRFDDAVATSDAALAVARRAGLHNTVQLLAAEAGFVRLTMGDLDGARERLEEAATVARRFGYRGGEGMAAVGRGLLLAREGGDLPTALASAVEGEHLVAQTGALPYLAAATSARGRLHEALGQLDEAAAAHRRVLDIGRTLKEAGISAIALEGLAGVAAAAGDPARAAALLAAADALRERGRRPRLPAEAEAVGRVGAGLLSALGPSGFAAAAGVADPDAVLAREEAVVPVGCGANPDRAPAGAGGDATVGSTTAASPSRRAHAIA